MTIRIVCFDPALRNLGIAICNVNLLDKTVEVEDLILIKTEQDQAKKERKNASDIRAAKKLYNAIQKYSQGCDYAVAEVPVGSQSSRACVSYGICVGVLASIQIPLVQVSPGEVKMASVGKRDATKEEMIAWAVNKHPHTGWIMRKAIGGIVPQNCNEHMADAVAVAYAGMENIAKATREFEEETSAIYRKKIDAICEKV